MIITKAKNIKREFYPFRYQFITLSFIYAIYAQIEPDDVLKFTKPKRKEDKRLRSFDMSHQYELL